MQHVSVRPTDTAMTGEKTLKDCGTYLISVGVPTESQHKNGKDGRCSKRSHLNILISSKWVSSIGFQKSPLLQKNDSSPTQLTVSKIN